MNKRKVNNLYCDESRVTSNSGEDYMVIGCVECPLEIKRDVFFEIDRLRHEFNVQGEFGWKTACPSKGVFFTNIADYFFSNNQLRFRCVVLSKSRNHFESDQERFEKTYYQVFNHWIKVHERYRVFIDRRIDDPGRVKTLRRCTVNTRNFGDSILSIEEVESHENNLVQLADLFIGAVGYESNKLIDRDGASEFKSSLCRHIAASAGLQSLAIGTGPLAEKFNIFHFGS